MNTRKVTTLLAATFLATSLATAASAKTLVYCSEGSPEGFDPALVFGLEGFAGLARMAAQHL